MCGRYAFSRIDRALLERLEAEGPDEAVEARWNVAPGQEAPVLRQQAATRQLEFMGWGFPRREGAGLIINARAETAASLPAFRQAFAGQDGAGRCLVPLSGWYEWVKDARLRRPHFLRPTGAGPFLMAGLWTQAERGPRFTLLTCPAAASIAHIHPRMPVVLPEHQWGAWLGLDGQDAQWFSRLCSWPQEELECWEVGPQVNSVTEDHAGLLSRAACIQTSLF